MTKKIILLLYLLSSFEVANTQSLEDQAVLWLKEFIKIDTINPPGNESKAVEFYKKIFDSEGITYNIAESAPGRGNIWARLKGGNEPSLILLQHTDVVPADPKYWTTGPLSGEEKDGYIWGRGALDMKGTGISQLVTFLNLHRSNAPLNRDVIFLATADEEAGGYYGVGWLTKNHPEIFKGAGLLINEGGSGESNDKETIFSVEVTQKVPVWLRLTTIDTPGHGSMPNASSSVTKMIGALNTLKNHSFEARIIPPVDAVFSSMSLSADEEWEEAYADMSLAIKEPGFLEKLQEYSPSQHALTRDTCSITRIGASNKINVVPPESWAEVDCRILPDRTSDEFILDFKSALSEHDVRVEVIMAFTSAVSSSNSRLYKAIEKITGERHPGSRVMPSVSTGFTDSHFTRDLGIASYGFDPIIVPEKEFTRIHGNDERVSVEGFRRGVRDLLAIISDVVYD
ncbi:MAG: M20/M25/M40 family metallo-hydrolase [Pseudomonadota bacterium]|nr:M20/M25/M40 family metallo-hydrolase [Pseudomonadota bacterium]